MTKLGLNGADFGLNSTDPLERALQGAPETLAGSDQQQRLQAQLLAGEIVKAQLLTEAIQSQLVDMPSAGGGGLYLREEEALRQANEIRGQRDNLPAPAAMSHTGWSPSELSDGIERQLGITADQLRVRMEEVTTMLENKATAIDTATRALANAEEEAQDQARAWNKTLEEVQTGPGPWQNEPPTPSIITGQSPVMSLASVVISEPVAPEPAGSGTGTDPDAAANPSPDTSANPSPDAAVDPSPDAAADPVDTASPVDTEPVAAPEPAVTTDQTAVAGPDDATDARTTPDA
jgi:hypothetical protein